MQPPAPGLGNANSYLVSGFPWLTGSSMPSGSFSTNNGEIRVGFPRVVSAFTVVSRGSGSIRVHFASIASGNVITGRHYLTLTQNDSYTFRNKCKEFFVSLVTGSLNGDFEVAAELTTIGVEMCGFPTGSGITT